MWIPSTEGGPQLRGSTTASPQKFTSLESTREVDSLSFEGPLTPQRASPLPQLRLSVLQDKVNFSLYSLKLPVQWQHKAAATAKLQIVARCYVVYAAFFSAEMAKKQYRTLSHTQANKPMYASRLERNFSRRQTSSSYSSSDKITYIELCGIMGRLM